MASIAPRKLIVIGASTGGVSVLEHILTRFPTDCPPTVVVQHTRDGYAQLLAERLNRQCAPQVQNTQAKQKLQSGHIYIASDTAAHAIIKEQVAGLVIEHLAAPPMSGHRPSVDSLFLSVAALRQKLRISAALLTGMGADGARGLLALHNNGAHTIAQDQKTSTIWGMPKVAIELGAASEVLPIDKIAASLLGS